LFVYCMVAVFAFSSWWLNGMVLWALLGHNTLQNLKILVHNIILGLLLKLCTADLWFSLFFEFFSRALWMELSIVRSALIHIFAPRWNIFVQKNISPGSCRSWTSWIREHFWGRIEDFGEVFIYHEIDLHECHYIRGKVNLFRHSWETWYQMNMYCAGRQDWCDNWSKITHTRVKISWTSGHASLCLVNLLQYQFLAVLWRKDGSTCFICDWRA
jgi:hypothetical protein